MPAIIAAAKAVTISVSISAGIGSVAGGIENVIDGGSFLDGALSGAKQGAIDGFMWGGVFTGGSQILSSGFKVARTLAPGFNGIKFGSSFKVFSPNSSTNPNIGGTILKFGKTFRLDVESYQLLHFHTAIFGKAHISITQWLGGLFGGLSR